MRTINKARKDLQIMVNIDNQVIGFTGTVAVYDANIYIDTRDGTGYEAVITKLMPLIHKLAAKYYFLGNMPEDAEQDVALYMLEGIPKYDPRKGTKLSTFLEMRIDRLLINKIRDKGRFCNSATFLNISSFRATCECGNSFSVTVAKNDEDLICEQCGKVVGNKVSINTPEVTESSLFNIGNIEADEEGTMDRLSMNDYALIGQVQLSAEEQIIANERIEALMERNDSKLAEIVDLVCYKDCSVKDAAKQVGISNAYANLKLKRLKDKRVVRDLFER
jgi:RNA polymerase sigma factor (sigma-70 family)